MADIKTTTLPKNVQVGQPQKKGNMFKVIGRLLSYAKKYRFLFGFVILLIVASSVLNVIGMFQIKTITAYFGEIKDGKAVFEYAELYRMLLIMGGFYVGATICAYAYARLMLMLCSRIMKALRDEMFITLQKLPVKYFDTHAHGDIMSRFTNDTDTLREFFSQSLPKTIDTVSTVIATFVMLFIANWALALIVVAMLVIMLAVVKVVGGKSGKYFIKRQTEIGRNNGYIEEYIEGQKAVKVFCREEKTVENFDSINERLNTATAKANGYANILMPILGNLGYLFYALIATVGGVLVLNGMATPSDIVVFLPLMRNVTLPIGNFSQQINIIMMAVAGAQRIFDIIDTPHEEDNGYVTLVNAKIDENGNITESETRTGKWAWKHPHHDGTLTYTELKGDVRFADVSFGYEENKQVLYDVSLYAKPGQQIAFVGATGAGKTTITNLINRFYDVPDGKIRYDGININKIKKADLRRSQAMVLQDTHLFTGTVADNIRFGKLDATDEEVINAAKIANADFFISHLPQGYDTMLTADGANLSQGQRQLIAIARAAIADPPVLILDEATSSIDTRTEAIIEKGMSELMKGKTVFVIAHRLSTVRRANAIMVLDHGRITERGTHEQLMSLKGTYYKLAQGLYELE